ncbi:unnamed protein product [Lampetra planeri]
MPTRAVVLGEAQASVPSVGATPPASVTAITMATGHEAIVQCHSAHSAIEQMHAKQSEARGRGAAHEAICTHDDDEACTDSGSRILSFDRLHEAAVRSETSFRTETPPFHFPGICGAREPRV